MREGSARIAGIALTLWIFHLQMGHFAAKFEQPGVARMVLNAVTWRP